MPELLPEYEPSVGTIIDALHSLWGHESSDPAKVARVILRLPASGRLPAHLLGSDAVKYDAEAEAVRAAAAERWREISVSTDFYMPRALPDLQFFTNPGLVFYCKLQWPPCAYRICSSCSSASAGAASDV
jgi:hypothetical protein